MREWTVLALAAAGSLLGCGGNAALDAPTGDAGDAGNTTAPDATAGRVPLQHRAQGTTCPEQRADSAPNSNASCTDRQLIQCTSDADCSAGKNGRCETRGPFPCYAQCSYDDCATDADCTDSQPCECRASATLGTANVCVKSAECRVDADCGAGGFCSPSVLDLCFCPSPSLCDGSSSCSPGPCSCGDSCGHGYFCHTKADTCIDDADCSNGGTCNYDKVDQRWECAECWPVI